MQAQSDTPSSYLWALWRSAVWSAAATAGRPRHKKVVAIARVPAAQDAPGGNHEG